MKDGKNLPNKEIEGAIYARVCPKVSYS